MEDDEQELSRRLRRGDLAAFDVIFTRYSRPLLRIAWLKTGDYEAAADVVQETLLVLWRRRADVPEQSMFPWLVGVLSRRSTITCGPFADTRRRPWKAPTSPRSR